MRAGGGPGCEPPQRPTALARYGWIVAAGAGAPFGGVI